MGNTSSGARYPLRSVAMAHGCATRPAAAGPRAPMHIMISLRARLHAPLCSGALEARTAVWLQLARQDQATQVMLTSAEGSTRTPSKRHNQSERVRSSKAVAAISTGRSIRSQQKMYYGQ